MEKFIANDTDLYLDFTVGSPVITVSNHFFVTFPHFVSILFYHGTTTAPITFEYQIKCAKPRLMSPEQELFPVLLLVETWIAFLNQRFRALPIWPSCKFVDNNMPAYFKLNIQNPCCNRLHRSSYQNTIFM